MMKQKRVQHNRLNHVTSIDDDSSSDESGTETSDSLIAPTPDSYGLIPVPAKPSSRFYVPVCGLIFYAMAFCGFFCALAIRQTPSVAIVAMVNHTTVDNMDTAMKNVSDQDECPRDPELRHASGQFNWDRYQQAIVLAAFSYGRVVTAIPGGFAADHFGGKWLFGGCILFSSLLSLLTPLAAGVHVGVVIALRILSGLGEGVLQPAINAMVARWSTPQRRTLVLGLMLVGRDAGIIVGTVLTGVLCDYGFAGGWPSAFYVYGMVGCVWSVAWFFLCYNSPYTHPRISRTEVEYWEQTLGSAHLASRPSTPWTSIFTSVPVWALAVAHFVNGWGFFFTVTNCLPLYMHDVLGFNMTKNGVFSTAPFLAAFVMIPFYGWLADWLRAPGRLSTTVVRKTACVVGFTSTAVLLVVAGYISCDRTLAVGTMFAVGAVASMGMSIVYLNPQDLAPLHAGKITGLVFVFAAMGASAAPMAVGSLTHEGSTRLEWQDVFYLTALIYIVGAIVFLIFGSGKRQKWAD